MGFDALYGLELADCSDELVRGRVPVGDELRAESGGHVHGGVYGAIAEALAARGTALAVGSEGRMAVGLANHVTSFRRVTDGVIHAVAVRRHRGRTTWVWEVEISDDGQRRCAIARVTIAVTDAGDDRVRDAGDDRVRDAGDDRVRDAGDDRGEGLLSRG